MNPTIKSPFAAKLIQGFGPPLAFSVLLASAHASVTYNNFDNGPFEGGGIGASVTLLDAAQGVNVSLITAGIIGQDGSAAPGVANTTFSNTSNDLGVDSVTNVGGYTNDARDFNPGEAWIFKFDVDVTLDEIRFAGWGAGSTVKISSAAFADKTQTTDTFSLGGETLTAGTEVRVELTNTTGDVEVRMDYLTVSALPIVTGAANLKWTGAGGNDWNTTPANTNWADTDNGDAAIFFSTDDNATIDTAATITVDGGGVSAGITTVSAASGTVSLAGGPLTTSILSKEGASTFSINNSINTGSNPANVTGGSLQIEAGATLTATGLTVSGGAGTELVINDPSASLVNSGTTALGTTGGRIRVASLASLSLGTITAAAPGAKLDKRSEGTLTVTGPVGSDPNPVDLDLIGGNLNFDGAVEVHVNNASNPNSVNGPITLDETELVLHGVSFQSSGSITSLNSASMIRSDFNGGNNTINVPVILSADLTVNAAAGTSAQTYQKAISGAGSLIKDGNGTVTLEVNNSYAGTTTVEAGTLRIGNDTTTGSLGTGDVILNIGSSTGTLDFRRNNTLLVPQNISGTGNVIVGGSGGTVALGGTNSFTGTTNVTAGTLLIDGDNSAATGGITVSPGAFIGGNGSSGATVVLDSGAGVAVSISDWTGAAGTGYDDLQVDILDLGNIINVAIDTTGLVNFTEAPASFTIINAPGGVLDSFTSENYSVSGSFPGTGTWSLAKTATSLVLSYAPAGGSDYDDWSGPSGFNLAGGPTDDDDFDGVSNEDEYAFGLDPTSGSSVSPISELLDPATGVFKYTRRIPPRSALA